MSTKLLLKPLLAVLLLALLPQAAAAYDFMVDGLCYNRNNGGTSVTVTYENSSWPHYSNLSGDLVIPSTVTYSGTTYSVTSIGDYAFYGCSGLTSVTIPNSVTTIGGGAFEGCSGLTSVTIGNSVTSIGNSVTSIGKYAFESCRGLTSVTIGNSVTSIGERAFYFCSGLTSVTIGNSVTYIGEWAFLDCNGIKKLTWNAINCTSNGDMSTSNIEQVTISYGVKVLPDYFVRGSKITSVTIPNSVTSIGKRAFYNCSRLTSVTIPNSVTSIGGGAFQGCSGLTSVTIPNSVTSIGGSAFSGCSGLESMVVEAGNTKYDSRDNCNAIIETTTNALIAGCKNTTIPNSVTSIGGGAFQGCSGLTSVTIPNSVTSIGNSAFNGCSGLELIHSEISNPANVQLGSTVFDNVPKSTCVLVVPAASLESYQSTSQWNEFTNIFAEMTSLDISEQSFELMRGKKQAIDVMTQPDNAWNQFVWTSSDNSVATVDEIGTVTAVSPGTATITAKYIFDSNLSDSCLVKVIPSCDVNDDDKVDIADVSLLINKMLEKNGALSIEYTDINGDNIVDIFDINEVISAMLGNGNLPEPPTAVKRK